MKYEADIQFGIIIGDKTTGIRDGKEEKRYKVIGIMGLKLDGMELVPCSLKDYKFKIEYTGDEIKIGTYLCTGINFVRYYGFWSKRKDCLDIFRSVLPVYDSKGNHLFTCGLDTVHLSLSFGLIASLDTKTLAYTISYDWYKPREIKLLESSLFFYTKSSLILGYDVIQCFFNKVSDYMFVYGSSCLLRRCDGDVILPNDCEYCISSLEDWKSSTVVLNKKLRYIRLGIRVIHRIKTVYMSKETNKSLLAFLLNNYVETYSPENTDVKDMRDSFRAIGKNLIKEDKFDEYIELCYDEKYKKLMEAVLKDVKFEFY
jgi:hypothetical protein